MIYVVVLEHLDGRVTYAGKESWDHKDEPEAVFTLNSARGKVRWWTERHELDHVELATISIKPARIEVSADVEKLVIPQST